MLVSPSIPAQTQLRHWYRRPEVPPLAPPVSQAHDTKKTPHVAAKALVFKNVIYSRSGRLWPQFDISICLNPESIIKFLFKLGLYTGQDTMITYSLTIITDSRIWLFPEPCPAVLRPVTVFLTVANQSQKSVSFRSNFSLKAFKVCQVGPVIAAMQLS